QDSDPQPPAAEPGLGRRARSRRGRAARRVRQRHASRARRSGRREREVRHSIDRRHLAGRAHQETSMRRLVHLLAGWALVQHSVAFAAETPFAAPEAAKAGSTSAAGGLAQVTLSLILVLAAVFASAWIVRRFRNFGRPGAGAINIIADV